VSWDAKLVDDRGHVEGDWNYTHNTNGMANAALDAGYQQRSVAEEVFRFQDKEHVSWWKRLNGLPGDAGAVLLDRIINAMEQDPARYESMNPGNDWGDYHGFLGVLREMRAAVPEWPTTWQVSG
jgi:hypothetical protein